MSDSHKSRRTCEICGVKEAHSREKMFFARFPLDVNRCKQWLKVVGNLDLVYLPIEKLHELKRVCGKHFRSRDLTKTGTRLKKHAIPRLLLTAAPLTDDYFAEFPMHIISTNVLEPVSEHVETQPRNEALLSVPSTSMEEPGPMPPSVPSTSKNSQSHHMSLPLPSTSMEELSTLPLHQRNQTELYPVNLVSHHTESQALAAKPLREHKQANIDVTPTKKRLMAHLKRTKCTLSSLKKSAKLVENLSSSVLKDFVLSALTNQSRKPQGKRWTTKNKISALSIFKRSPKGYRYLQHIIPLPSTKTLQNILKKVPMEPGINNIVIKHLKKISENMDIKDKFCVLLFDEMALKPRLVYNQATDKVEGFVDYGDQNGRTQELANHALAFMLQGIKKKFKQPIAFYFTKDTVSSQKLACLIKELIDAVNETGFKIIATVCDQGSTNMGALSLLKTWHNGGDNFFKWGNENIHIVYDVPHLFKNIRNNFLKNGNIHMNGKEGKWKHIEEVEEQIRNFLYMSKITGTHIKPQYRAKMKVKYAAQILSQTVAAVLKLLSKSKENEDRSQKLLETALIVEDLNRLFDYTNGPSGPDDIKKGIRENVSAKTNHVEIWNEYKKKMEKVKFVNKYGLEANNVKCIQGYIVTLKSLGDIWHLVHDRGFKYLNLRQLNQDSLENLFGIIRQHSPTNKHPTCSTFMAAMKTSTISGMTAPHSRGSNCEKDGQSLLTDFHNIIFDKEDKSSTSSTKENAAQEHEDEALDIPELPTLSIPDLEMEHIDIHEDLANITQQPLVYVSGFIASIILKNNSCTTCKQSLSVDPIPSDSKYEYIRLREWWTDKKSLTYPSENLCKIVQTALKVFEELGISSLHKLNIGQYIVTLFMIHCDSALWFCPRHREKINVIFYRLAILFVRRQCQKVNIALSTNEEKLADAYKKGQQFGTAK